MKIVDAHLHLFALHAGKYEWLKPHNPPHWTDKHIIAQATSERDLQLNSAQCLAGYVHIEGGFDNERPWREIQFLESHCRLPFKSVACVDLLNPLVRSHIDKLARYSSVAGVRHILDGDAARLLNHPKVQYGLRHCAEQGLSFDAQLDVSDLASLKALLNVLDKVPELNVVLNHIGGTPTWGTPTWGTPTWGTPTRGINCTSLQWRRWRNNMQSLAQYSQVAIKVSGWEMFNRQWHWRAVSPIVEALLELFGPHRIMMASNFPLSNWCYRYRILWQHYEQLLSRYPSAVVSALTAGNAIKWYGVNVASACDSH